MAIAVGLAKKARTIEGVEGWPFRAVGEAMEVIPRTLVQNCGGNAIRVLTQLRVRYLIARRGWLLLRGLIISTRQAKHAAGEHQFGVDGETGKVVDMKEYGLYESAAVKVQTLKTAIEVRSILPSFWSVRSSFLPSLPVRLPPPSRRRVRLSFHLFFPKLNRPNPSFLSQYRVGTSTKRGRARRWCPEHGRRTGRGR